MWDVLPWPMTVVLVVLLFDLADYWTHRWMHKSLLWGIHAVHHSEQRMTWITSSRVHIFETTVMKLGYVAMLGWVGVPPWALLAANVVAYMHNRYVHCDVGWNHGPLAKVIASPNWHRWHHSIDPSAYDRNFANIFSFIDVIFGTYHNPGPCRTAVGLAELPDPGVLNQLLYPFSYLLGRLKKGRVVECGEVTG
jgi:sterol desaturase/sphingolipid hydroxylase (fatty acid hydroxylase superfamily)